MVFNCDDKNVIEKSEKKDKLKVVKMASYWLFMSRFLKTMRAVEEVCMECTLVFVYDELVGIRVEDLLVELGLETASVEHEVVVSVHTILGEDVLLLFHRCCHKHLLLSFLVVVAAASSSVDAVVSKTKMVWEEGGEEHF